MPGEHCHAEMALSMVQWHRMHGRLQPSEHLIAQHIEGHHAVWCRARNMVGMHISCALATIVM